MTRGADPRIDPRDPVPCDGSGWLPCPPHSFCGAGNPDCDPPACDGCDACAERPECPTCNGPIDDPDDAHSIDGVAVHEDCCAHCAADDALAEFIRSRKEPCHVAPHGGCVTANVGDQRLSPEDRAMADAVRDEAEHWRTTPGGKPIGVIDHDPCETCDDEETIECTACPELHLCQHPPRPCPTCHPIAAAW